MSAILHTVILAGGASSRMGRDKALLPVAGVPMLQRIAGTALRVCPNLLLVGRAAPHGWPATLPANFLPDFAVAAADPTRSAGPLIGLITALEHLNSPLLLLSCDLPLIAAETLRMLMAAHAPESLATLAVSQTATGCEAEPTLAVYTPRLLPALRNMLAENRRSLQPLIHVPGVATWLVPEDRRAELLNVNDPQSLAQAESYLKKSAGGDIPIGH